MKSDAAFNQFSQWENDYRDAAKLSSWSLGELGSRIEFTIHNQMPHALGSQPVQTGTRPDVDVSHPEKIDTKWDEVIYDCLGDTYSSHVNSVFWKIHGWVDNRIEDWKRAHNISGEISWQGKWLGKPMSHPADDQPFPRRLRETSGEHQYRENQIPGSRRCGRATRRRNGGLNRNVEWGQFYRMDC